MTWAIDEEFSEFTYWFCSECGGEIVAWEDESKERDCPSCGKEKGQMFMWDRASAFWYCVGCRARIRHDGPKPDWVEV